MCIIFISEQTATISFIICLSVHMEQLSFHWTDCHEILYLSIFWKSIKKIQVSLKCNKNNGYVTWRPICIFIIAHWILFRMRNVWTKVVEKVKTQILCSITFFFFKNRAIYEIMWKNTVEWGRLQMTIWRMHIACWIPTTTNTRTEYVTLMDFPLQQWLHGRTSVLYYMYVACLVVTEMKSVYCTVHCGCWNKVDCASCLMGNCHNDINWNGRCASYCVFVLADWNTGCAAGDARTGPCFPSRRVYS